MQNTPTRAFVTGASGFVGAHLVYALLEKECVVSALIRSKNNLSAFNALSGLYPNIDTSLISWIEGDLLEPEIWMEHLNAVDVVFHAAAVVSFSPKDRQTMMETNVQGTANIVNACLKNKHIPLVYVSSVAALSRAEGQTEVTENTTWKDTDHNTHYAISKHLAEQEVWRGMEEGLRVAIVCPGIIIGPWDKPTGSGQIPALVKKKLPFYPVGENGFVGVRDVVAMMVALYESQQFDKRFLCVAENSSYKNVLTLFAEGFGVPKPYVAIKGFLLCFLIVAARLFELL
ncbi:MAG: SDR family oxidoreductase, partial [Sphingomonadales bacterium]